MPFHDQSLFDVRLDWGLRGLETISRDAAVVIVDVLSFSTCVSIACERNATVYPCQKNQERARELALRVGAEVAIRRSEPGRAISQGRFSLSPASLLKAHADLRLVLPSPNGSALAQAAQGESRTVLAGCLRNATAVANWLSCRLGCRASRRAGRRFGCACPDRGGLPTCSMTRAEGPCGSLSSDAEMRFGPR
jgi:2-phosphosulfolactate phosphatase